MTRIQSKFLHTAKVGPVFKVLMLCFIGLFALAAQANILDQLKTDFRFNPLPNGTQLSNVVINDVIQDPHGFIWIATDDGLNRYDGYKSVVYRPSKKQSSTSLSHYSISSLALDQSGVLWVGTENGLNQYHLESDSFTQIGTNTNNSNRLSGQVIQNIFIDSLNRIWVSSDDGGIDLISADRKTITPIKVSPNDLTDKAIYFRDFVELDSTTIMVASNRGLFQFNSQVTQLEAIKRAKPSYKSSNILRLMQADKSSILLGTTNGLFSYNLINQEYTPVLPQTLNKKIITDILKLDQNNILLGTRKSGLFKVNLINKTFKQFQNSTQEYSLIDNQILSLYRSKDNLVWVGTNLGINLISPLQQQFNHIKSNDKLKECLSGNTVYSILYSASNSLWVSAWGKGLHHIDLNTGKCKLYQHKNPLKKDSKLKYVVALHEDSNGNIWIGSYDAGLFRLDSSTQKITSPFINNQDKNIETPRYITSIAEDSDGSLWVSTSLRGLFKVNKASVAFEQFLPFEKVRPKKVVKAISYVSFDGEDSLWIATASKGLWKYSIANNEFSHIRQLGKNNYSLPNDLLTVTVDSNRRLWIGTQGAGALSYSFQAKTLTPYTIENGLQSNAVMNVILDRDKNAWLMTDKGISRIDHRSESIQTFLEKDGLQNNSFTTAGAFDPINNRLWTGGINGFNYFTPSEISNGINNQTAKITHFELFYKPVKLATKEQNSPLSQNIITTDSIQLDYTENVFSFSFSGLDYLYPERIKYRFMLEGYDNQWNEVDAERRFANYTNINPGQYKFRVKASNQYGQWDDQETIVDIIITPPWWQTNWAIFAYFIIFFSVLYAFINVRTRVLQKRAKALEKKVAVRTHELAEEKSKVEKLLSRKNEEFANISHEFRTPLTLILGPLAQVLKADIDPQEINRLNIVQRNSYRLLRMVDQLLNLETFRVKSITHKTPQQIGKTIHLLTEAFADLANEKDISLTLKHRLNINFSFTPDAFEKIFLNLLSNAIKYTRAGGSIIVDCERTQHDELKLTVKDTGIGIPKDKLDSVFERYNRVLDENSEQVTGAGIGLSLVKELVVAHKGQIEIDSQLGEGTTITLLLPIIDEVGDDQVNTHSNNEIIAMELMGLTGQQIDSDNQDLNINQQTTSDKPTLLVIEDNPDMRAHITNSISDDYHVLTAVNGKEGLVVAIEQVPDLIISDIMMPVMDGYETTHSLRRNPITNHIPIILLTARGDRESRLKGWFERADEYLTKPFDAEELKIRLHNLLDIRNILKKRFAEETFTHTSKSLVDTAVESSQKITPYSNENEIETQQQKLQQAFVEKLNLELETFYTQSATSIADIASAMAMSDRQFFRKMKSVLDMTPNEYLRRFRLEKARQLLNLGKNMSFVTFEVGFSSQSYFGKCFKAQYGVSPSEYKKQLSSDTQ